MSHSLFCYGTLEVQDILRKVTGTLLPSTSAKLPGYACYQVTGAAYPGIIEQPGGCTAGTLYTAITPQLLARIDLYEGDMYTRQRVKVTTEQTSTVSAWTYVIADNYRHRLSDQSWDRHTFLHDMAEAYLKTL